MFFVTVKMVSAIEKIFSKAETMIFVTTTVFFVTEKIFCEAEKMFFATEKLVSLSKTSFWRLRRCFR